MTERVESDGSTRRPAIRRMLRLRKDGLCLLVIFVAVIVANGLFLFGFFDPNPLNALSGIGVVTKAGVFLGSSNLDPNSGFTAQALGHLAASDLIHGHLPWWNPFEGVGSPLASEMQSGALFPLTPLLVLHNGQLWFHIILEALSGWFTYLLLRRLHLSRWAATLGGVAFALNGSFAWLAHAPVNPIAFLPLVILGLEYAVDATRSKRPGGWIVVALALALSFYAGFPETAYIDGIFAGVWTVVALVRLRHQGIRPFLMKLAAGITAGALLAAPLAVAFLDYLPHADLGDHSVGFGGVVLPQTGLSSLLLPYVYGPVAGFSPFERGGGTLYAQWGQLGGYLTASLVLLAFAGLWGRRLRVIRWALALWIALSIGREFGAAPLLHLINLLPGMGQVAFFRYSQPSLEFAVVILAMFGLDDIIKRRVPRWWMILSFALGLLGILLAYLGSQALLKDLRRAPQVIGWNEASAYWALFAVVVVAFGAIVLRPRIAKVIIFAVVLVDVMAMFIVPELSATRTAHLDLKPVEFLQKHLGTERFYTLGPVAPNYGSFFDVNELATNDLPVPKLWSHFLLGQLNPNADAVLFTGAFQKNPRGQTPAQAFLSRIPAYENAGVKYLVLSAGQVLPPPPHGQQLTLVFEDKLIEIEQLPNPQPMYSSVHDSCLFRAARTDSVIVYCAHPDVLLRRELFMPGWTATVNHKSKAVAEEGRIFQSVDLPKGGSYLTFNFSPPYIVLSYFAFALGVLIALLWGAHSTRERYQTPTPPIDEAMPQ